jgi:hypothetical protein
MTTAIPENKWLILQVIFFLLIRSRDYSCEKVAMWWTKNVNIDNNNKIKLSNNFCGVAPDPASIDSVHLK